MPIINVQMLTGRTSDQKSKFIHDLAEVTRKALGVPEEAIRIVLTEVSPENWGHGSRNMVEILRERQANRGPG